MIENLTTEAERVLALRSEADRAWREYEIARAALAAQLADFTELPVPPGSAERERLTSRQSDMIGAAFEMHYRSMIRIARRWFTGRTMDREEAAEWTVSRAADRVIAWVLSGEVRADSVWRLSAWVRAIHAEAPYYRRDSRLTVGDGCPVVLDDDSDIGDGIRSAWRRLSPEEFAALLTTILAASSRSPDCGQSVIAGWVQFPALTVADRSRARGVSADTGRKQEQRVRAALSESALAHLVDR